MYDSLSLLRSHSRVEIGQVIELAGRPDRRPVPRVKTEEVHAGPAGERYIGTHVQLRKAGKAGQRWQSTRTNAAHAKRDDPDPAVAIVSIEYELRWDKRAKCGRQQRPVGEEQIVPELLHDPGAGWEWPGTMRH